jgi:hypothetical protein
MVGGKYRAGWGILSGRRLAKWNLDLIFGFYILVLPPELNFRFCSLIFKFKIRWGWQSLNLDFPT